MASLNQIIKERKIVFKNLKKALKIVDTSLEKSERLQNRVLERKLKVPEDTDLEKLGAYVGEMAAGMKVYLSILDAGFPI